MDPSVLNHPIKIERKIQIGLLDLGDPKYVWQTFVEVFSEVSVHRGREHFDQATKQRYSEDVWHFRVHYEDVTGIDSSMRVVDEAGQIYDIKSIRPDAEYRQDCIIECTAQDAVVGAAPLAGYIDEAIPAGVSGKAYEGFTVKAKGGVTPYVFSAVSGLPAGLSVNSSTGAIAGTPTVPGVASLVIKVRDAARNEHVLPAIAITISA